MEWLRGAKAEGVPTGQQTVSGKNGELRRASNVMLPAPREKRLIDGWGQLVMLWKSRMIGRSGTVAGCKGRGGVYRTANGEVAKEGHNAACRDRRVGGHSWLATPWMG